jgi:hypothetical protein
MVLALPSEDQAEILTEWLGNEHIRYPDITEAIEVWCYKVANRRHTGQPWQGHTLIICFSSFC